jgi:hypothetical protein
MGQTWYKGAFVTMPEDVIDSEWVGGVMSPNYSFSALRMYKFTDHYFCNYNGVIFDATANLTHASTDTMVAFDLRALSDAERNAFNAVQGPPSYEVTNVSPQFQPRPHLNLNQGRWVLLALGDDTLVEGGKNRAFNKYLLTNQTRVSKSEIENFTMESGRTSKRVRGA